MDSRFIVMLTDNVLLFVLECGGTLNATSSSLSSPNFPHHYPLNAHCDWVIKVPFGHVINITIAALDIEYYSGCDYDFLELYDGRSAKSHKLGE